jgi:hypothetical protein
VDFENKVFPSWLNILISRAFESREVIMTLVYSLVNVFSFEILLSNESGVFENPNK